MKWRWLFFDYVDPQLNLSREQRRVVRRLVWKARDLRQTPAHAWGRRFRWIELLTPLIPPAVMAVVAVTMLFSTFFTGWPILLLIAVQMTVTWILFALVGRISWKPRVHSALGELGYDVCRRCGYWLRGLTDAEHRCPECGQEKTHQV